jgi:hypothetical protein
MGDLNSRSGTKPNRTGASERLRPRGTPAA